MAAGMAAVGVISSRGADSPLDGKPPVPSAAGHVREAETRRLIADGSADSSHVAERERRQYTQLTFESCKQRRHTQPPSLANALAPGQLPHIVLLQRLVRCMTTEQWSWLQSRRHRGIRSSRRHPDRPAVRCLP